MSLTKEDSGTRAVCASCGHTLTIAVGPGKKRKADGVDTRPSSPIHEIATRIEVAPKPVQPVTTMLSPPLGLGEIGRLGGYRVLEVVGSGGMGVVFRAEDPLLQREVALKAMLPTIAASETARQRFLREARNLAAIQHDRIVPIYQVGEENGTPWLAMPFLRGETLETRVRRGPLPVVDVLRIGAEIAEGLGAIHECGMVHRDIKPANVWLEGPAARVKLLDFGVARSGADVSLTLDGALVGSPAFMSPEQAMRKPVDHRADLFALGVVLYQMATGHLPFEGEDALAVLLAITSAEPEPITRHVPELPPRLEQLVQRLLAKAPEGRPASATEAGGELERLLRAAQVGL
jgi:serine/threonine protein kinase